MHVVKLEIGVHSFESVEHGLVWGPGLAGVVVVGVLKSAVWFKGMRKDWRLPFGWRTRNFSVSAL
jgi:hypothetical protein